MDGGLTVYQEPGLWQPLLAAGLAVSGLSRQLRARIFKRAQESISRAVAGGRAGGRYDNPMPTQFLAPIDCLKIPALSNELTELGQHFRL